MRTLVALSLMAVMLAGCTTETNRDLSSEETATICTNFGAIEVNLFTEAAPITTDNFVKLAKSGYYNDVVFHRIITGFMMQGGDPTGTGSGGAAFGGGSIPDEFSPDARHNKAGILSMANAGPNTGGSQFFITFDATSWLDDAHTVFGEVTKGMNVVQTIEEVAATGGGTPRTDVYMTTVLAPAGICPDLPPEPEPVPAFACDQPDLRDATNGVDQDTITPGVFCITNQNDSILVWARNYGTAESNIEWELTGENGGDLPSGWQATFTDASATLSPAGENGEAAYTMLELYVPQDATNASLELHTGKSSTPIFAQVDLRHDELSAFGSSVTATYRGVCASDPDAAPFDEGEFPLQLGGGRAIVGFDRGLIGMGASETATILIPAPMAYGSEGGPCVGDNADLVFDVGIAKLK